MVTIKCLSLSAIIMESEELWKVGRLLLAGPTVYNLCLELLSRRSATQILSATSCPALKFLHIRSPYPVDVDMSFLHRHRNLFSISLFTFDMPLAPSTRHRLTRGLLVRDKKPPSGICLPHLSFLQFSANYCSWLSVFGMTSAPKSLCLVPMKWYPKPSQFCETLQGLCYSLRALAMKKTTVAELEINFPTGLITQVNRFHKVTLCETPSVSIGGVKDLKLVFPLSSESLSLVR
jgi:hypothetical protein